MRYLTITIVIFMLAGMTGLSGQCLNKVKKQIAAYEYAQAIPSLEKIIEKDKKGKDEAVVLLAKCYRMLNEDEKAASYYAMAIEQDTVDPIVYFHYGQMLRTLEKYDLAATQFNKYASLVPDDKRGELLAGFCKDISCWLDECEYENPTNVASLNSPFSDFSPAFYKQGVVFTSERPQDYSQGETFEWTGNPYLGLMFAWINGMLSEGEPIFTDPEVFDENLVQQYHNGNAAFSSDGKIMMFTRTQEERVPKDNERFRTHYLKLFQSEFDGKNWSQPEPFTYNSDNYSVGHPAFSADGNKLYFVSNMPGGQGGSDIWVCTKKDEKWSDPQNLGSVVNTIMDEVFPYMDCKGKLYFSSEGHLGYGGLDIFYTSEVSGNWDKPTNMMGGVNTSYDDFGVAIDHKMEIGLVSSNRPGGQGSDDIYAFSIKPKPLEICGKVIDPNYKPIEGATIFLLNNKSNMVHILKTDSEGKYCIELEDNVSCSILGKKLSYEDNCLGFTSSEINLRPDDLVLNPYKVDKTYEVGDIYYDLDKYQVRKEEQPALDELAKTMKLQPITIELGSHTDCRGSEEYNIELSQKRAESVIRYLILQGIDPSRMTAKGYGETMPVNDCKDGVTCTEEEHQSNRRTEFKVTGVISEQGDYSLSRYFEGDVIPMERFELGFFDVCGK